jgi:hypothetical protein
VAVTGGAMLLVGLGLRRSGGDRGLAAVSLGCAAAFLVLNGLIALRDPVEALNESKGWFQRGGQLVLGGWLLVLAVRTRRPAPHRPR